MDTPTNWLAQAALVGVAATAVMDAWLLALQRSGVPTLDFALLGRWAGHLARGRVRHAAIRAAPPLRGERALGWLVHYAVGIGLALAFVTWQGPDWLARPQVLPALAWGLVTTAAPLLLLQPALGAGIASRRTPTPLKNCLRSVANHAVFGFGLYLGAMARVALRS